MTPSIQIVVGIKEKEIMDKIKKRHNLKGLNHVVHLLLNLYEREYVSDGCLVAKEFIELHNRYKAYFSEIDEGMFELFRVVLLTQKDKKTKTARKIFAEIIQHYPDSEQQNEEPNAVNAGGTREKQ